MSAPVADDVVKISSSPRYDVFRTGTADLGESDIVPQRKRLNPVHEQLRRSLLREQRRASNSRLPAQKSRIFEQSTGGTTLCWRQPTPERVSLPLTSYLPRFNHGLVGITHPCLRLASRPLPPVRGSVNEASLNDLYHRRTEGATVATAESSMAEWWPPTAGAIPAGWRVTRLRQCVGHGWQSYQAVRDAALQWEFPNHSSTRQGIVLPKMVSDEPRHRFKRRDTEFVPQRYDVIQTFRNALDNGESSNDDDDGMTFHGVCNRALQIWSGPGRRLVTYTSIGGNPDNGTPAPPTITQDPTVLVKKKERFLAQRLQALTAGATRLLQGAVPRLYVVNPVAVVYDLVDQPVPSASSSCVFSATSFATLQGHWLCGEERVSVIYRRPKVVLPTASSHVPRRRSALRSWIPMRSGAVMASAPSRDSIHDGGAVDVEILSISKPADSIMGRFVWPWVKRPQNCFFLEQMEHFQRVARLET
jgi:uncharacterized protein (UPF0548 family)